MAGHSVIVNVSFGLSNDQDHRRDSFATVTSFELNSPAGTPVVGGVNDLRMGTVDHAADCLTCRQGKKLCPGHRGDMRMRVAVPQPLAIVEIRRWLRIVCFKCGEIVVDPAKYRALPRARRLTVAANAVAEGAVCPRCKAVHPRVANDDGDHFTFWAEAAGSDKKKRGAKGPHAGDKIYPDAIRAVFEKVSDSAAALMGKAEVPPRDLILRVIPVLPVVYRPGAKAFGGAGSSYHDSTNLLQNLMKRNGHLPEQLPGWLTSPGDGSGRLIDPELDRTVANAQQLYYDLVLGSGATSATQGNSGKRGLVVGSRPVGSILRRIPKKEGRIRANLLGCRTFFISRSTISGNMRLRIDEVALPLAFARKLQIVERVQEYNLEWLMPFFLNGARQYPGCTRVVRRATGEAHNVDHASAARLEVGDTLFRDLVDGDLVFFNRQPTLERSSIGVHKVVVTSDPGVHTFRMNVMSCENYNADFNRSPTGSCL